MSSAQDHEQGGTGETEAFKAFEAAGWGARAETYEQVTGRLTAQAIEPLLDAASVGPGVRVLDLGTGTGAIAAAGASRGATSVGIDLAQQMVARARTRHPQLEFRTGDAESLPFAEGEFGAVVAGFVFNHLPRPEQAAAECSRVLSPGSRLAVSVWDEPQNAPFFGVVAEAIRQAGVDSASRLPSPGPDPYRFARAKELEELLTGAGFGAVQVRSLELSVDVADAQELLAGILGGTVRAATVLDGASGDELAAVQTALRRVAADYGAESGLRLPARIKLAWGEKTPKAAQRR